MVIAQYVWSLWCAAWWRRAEGGMFQSPGVSGFRPVAIGAVGAGMRLNIDTAMHCCDQARMAALLR